MGDVTVNRRRKRFASPSAGFESIHILFPSFAETHLEQVSRRVSRSANRAPRASLWKQQEALSSSTALVAVVSCCGFGSGLEAVGIFHFMSAAAAERADD